MNFFSIMGDALGTLFGFVLWFFFDLFNSFIPAALVFVIIIKLISFPFELKSRKAMLKNAELSAKMQELQKRYANNRQKLNEETMKLYEKEGVNPLGGCLPQLFPLLIFTGVYSAIVRPITNLFHVSAETLVAATDVVRNMPEFSGILSSTYAQLDLIKIFPQIGDKLTMFTPEQVSDIMDFNHGFNFFGLDLFAVPISSDFASLAWIWPVLSTLTMLASVFISQRLNYAAQQQQPPGCMRFMPYMLPFVFVTITLYAPAALGAYYTILNLLSIIQVFITARFFGPRALAAREEAARIARLLAEESAVPRANSHDKP